MAIACSDCFDGNTKCRPKWARDVLTASRITQFHCRDKKSYISSARKLHLNSAAAITQSFGEHERNHMAANDRELPDPAGPLAAGTIAPHFSLHTTPDQTVSIHEFRGQPLILAFYPADWSPVCGDQMSLYNELLPEFKKFRAVLLGISVDGVWCHLAYSKDRKLKFALMSDFEPKGRMARSYGVYRKQDGVCERALFVIDDKGTIRWSYVSPIGVNPGADGILNALEQFAPQEANT